MLRFGLLGCGKHGERYLRHLAHDVPGACAVALYRRDRAAAEQLAQKYDLAMAASPTELVSRVDVDAILITTPPGAHLEDLRVALQSGKAILIEKPILAQASQIAAARALLAQHPKARLMVAHTLRFSPILGAAKRMLPEIGAIHRIRAAQRLEPSRLAWQRDAAVAGGGSVTLTGVHLFDLLRWFVGRTPDAVQCRLLRLGGHPLENCFDACFEFEAEAILAATEVSKFAAVRSGTLECVGEAGQLWVDYLHGTLHLQRERTTRLLEQTGDVPTLPETLRAFLRYVLEESPNPLPAAAGFATLEMAAACYDAHAQGQRVRIATNSGEDA